MNLLEGPSCRTQGSRPQWCGKVLIEGGSTGLQSQTVAALYTPESDTWQPAASLPYPVGEHTATLLDGESCRTATPPAYCGKVLIAGGSASASGSAPLATALLYDPSLGTLGTWLPTGPLVVPHAFHTATLLDSAACRSSDPPAYCGKVLVTGGGLGAQGIADTELYDPNLGTWTSSEPLKTARNFHEALPLNNGAALVAGGVTDLGTVLTSTEIFDPLGNSGVGAWTPGPAMNRPRVHPSAVSLPNSSILMIGGSSSFDTPDATGQTVEMYTPPSSDLSISTAVVPDPATVGQDLTYDLSVSNAGRDTAGSVSLQDRMPTGTTFKSASPAAGQPGSCTPGAGTVQCALGDLASGANRSVRIVVVPSQVSSQPVTLTNSASVSTISHDPNLANNTSVVQTLLNPLLNLGGPTQPGPTQPGPSSPQVTGLSEDCGPGSGGSSVTVRGTGFTGAALVKFGDAVASSFVVKTDSEISVTSPAHGDGGVNVTVTGPGGASGASPASSFTYPCPQRAPKPPAEGGFLGTGGPQAAQKTTLIAPPGGTGFSATPAHVPVLGQAPGLSAGPAGGPSAGTSFNPGSALASAPGQFGQPGAASVTVGAVDAVQEDSQPALQIHQFVGRNQSPVGLVWLPLAGVALMGCAIPIAGRKRRSEAAIQAAPARA